MCDVDVYREYLDRLEDYLDYVNTDVERHMLWEPDLYAGYGAYNGLKVEEIKNWYRDAEEQFITTGDPDDYIRRQYDHDIIEDAVWDLVDREIDEGRIYECGGYWFLAD